MTCPCTPRGVTARDQARHDAYHLLVLEQTGITGRVDLAALREARGARTLSLPTETVLDERARASGKRASGALRRAG